MYVNVCCSFLFLLCFGMFSSVYNQMRC
jgi:hypothetical protein